jgi:hypothetical protein
MKKVRAFGGRPSGAEGDLLSRLLSETDRIDITPAVPVSMGGYGQRAEQLSRDVNDLLFAKALYLGSETARFLMITTDLICIPNGLAHEVTEEITAKISVDAEQGWPGGRLAQRRGTGEDAERGDK